MSPFIKSKTSQMAAFARPAFVIIAGLAAAVPASAATVTPYPGMVITQTTTFTPGTYSFPGGQGITIAANNITVNGNGAVLVGPGMAGLPDSFAGTGVTSSNTTGVVLHNLTARGFYVGLQVKSASAWTITRNDFSNNYTNPADLRFGVDTPAGAIRLLSVSRSTITQNTGDNCWNGLYLEYSDSNTISRNHFSPSSNISLKMWGSSANVIDGNVMSYGLRVDPGNPNALDSASLLLETGSSNNTIENNDFTHGGDGVFVRTGNGVISTGNYFYNNDASYAFNNAWECRSPGNTFKHNKGNYSSYGFWLGGSLHTLLEDNEAAYNGTTSNRQGSEFGIAGIAVFYDPSSHFICRHNNVHDNNGAGIAIGNPNGYEAFHWVLQQNTIANNTGYGIYLHSARWLDIAGNTMFGNGAGDLYTGDNVNDVFLRTATAADLAPKASATASSTSTVVGAPIHFDASGSASPSHRPLAYRWSLGDGTIETTARVRHSYAAPGFYRVGVTVNDGRLADLAWFDVYVTDNTPEIGTQGQAAQWSFFDPDEPNATASFTNDAVNRIVGASSVRMTTDSGFPFHWFYPAQRNAALDVTGRQTLAFWVKRLNSTPLGWQDGIIFNPTIRLGTDANNYFEYAPREDVFLSSPNEEDWYGWQYITVPLAGDAFWVRTTVGSPSLSTINSVELITDTWDHGYTIWIDGLGFK
jgi:parallel beta-helix repeat protein